ncbi:MAG: hypothetical protein AB1894_25345 [Chloroflexota bacterium]
MNKALTNGSPAAGVTYAERRWVWVFAALVMALTSLPYVLGYAFENQQSVFSGFIFAVEDGNSYIAKMLSGAYGAWLFRTPYTAYPQKGVLMFLPYLLLGKLVSPPGMHVQLVALYHWFRIGAGFLAVLATYDFLTYFIQSVPLRRFGLALATLGGGLGWILVLGGRDSWLGSLPLEFYSPETFGFLGLYGFAHLALARALLLWALLAYLRALDAPDQGLAKPALKITALWLLAGLAQPLVTLVIGGVIGLYLAGMVAWQMWMSRQGTLPGWARWRRAMLLAIWAGILPVVLVFYNLWAMRSDPFLQLWTNQNLILSPHPAHYLLAYGLVLPFAWVGGISTWRKDAWRGGLLVCWALALPLLAYVPVNLQRRLPEGGWVAWVVLAMIAMEGWRSQAGEAVRRSRWAAWLFCLAFPSTLFLLLGGVLSTLRPTTPIFRPSDEVACFLYLAEHAQVGDEVLSAYETGNALPAWAPVRVVIGHGPESVNLAVLRSDVSRFYSPGTLGQERLNLITQQKVRYVFWGPTEQALGSWEPTQASYLRSVFQSGVYTVFEVAAESP